MDNNSPYEALPGYWRNSKRELGRGGSKADTTYANIRKRLNAAIISVPYEKGLGSLHVLSGKNGHKRLSPIDKSIFQKVQNKHYHDVSSRMSGSRNTSEHTTPSPRKVNLSPIRTRGVRPHDGTPNSRGGSYRSQDGVSLPSRHSKARSDRIGSETSTVSTKSRPYSFSNSEFDESFWMNNLQHIEELKEKYSENSEFVASIHGFRYQKELEAKKKELERLKMEKLQIESKPKSQESDMANEKVLHFLENRSPRGRKHTPEEKGGRLTLPPIHHLIEEDRRSEGSGWTIPSYSGSSISTVKSKKSSRENSRPKRRKVEFNLIPRKKLVLPPLTPSDDTKFFRNAKPKKSILKNSTSSLHMRPRPPLESPGVGEVHNKTSWEEHLPRLRSPVPLSAARRDPSVFQGNSRGFYFKCSKEFEAALEYIETE